MSEEIEKQKRFYLNNCDIVVKVPMTWIYRTAPSDLLADYPSKFKFGEITCREFPRLTQASGVALPIYTYIGIEKSSYSNKTLSYYRKGELVYLKGPAPVLKVFDFDGMEQELLSLNLNQEHKRILNYVFDEFKKRYRENYTDLIKKSKNWSLSVWCEFNPYLFDSTFSHNYSLGLPILIHKLLNPGYDLSKVIKATVHPLNDFKCLFLWSWLAGSGYCNGADFYNAIFEHKNCRPLTINFSNIPHLTSDDTDITLEQFIHASLLINSSEIKHTYDNNFPGNVLIADCQIEDKELSGLVGNEECIVSHKNNLLTVAGDKYLILKIKQKIKSLGLGEILYDSVDDGWQTEGARILKPDEYKTVDKKIEKKNIPFLSENQKKDLPYVVFRSDESGIGTEEDFVSQEGMKELCSDKDKYDIFIYHQNIHLKDRQPIHLDGFKYNLLILLLRYKDAAIPVNPLFRKAKTGEDDRSSDDDTAVYNDWVKPTICELRKDLAIDAFKITKERKQPIVCSGYFSFCIILNKKLDKRYFLSEPEYNVLAE